MKTAFILAFILLLLSFHSNAQQTIDKLNVNQLKLPKESANKALILDGAGQVKSSSTITDTELGYLEGLSDTLVNLLSGKANDSDVVKLSGNQSVDGVKTFTGKLVASSTVNGSIPCPVMTEAQRDLFTPVEGDCVYNSDTLKLNVFDGSVWKDVGGAGGISLWLTANPYNVNDIVIESDKIYRCLIAHTSGVFATDLGAGNWGEVSQGLTSPVALSDGGTGASIIPLVGSIVYVDSDSFEQLTPGSPGQILQLDGSFLPSWVNKTEYVAPNNLETPINSTQVLLESGNKNILTNPSFENSTFESGGWVNFAGIFTENFANKVDGAKSARLVLSSQTMSLTQSSALYESSFADGVQGLASVWVKSNVALKVCAVRAGVVSTSLCVDVQANNKWGFYKVPFILGATSNGISIASTGAVTGTVFIDDAFVGAASLTQNMNACNDPSCETVFSARISSASPAVTSLENLDFINGNCTRSGANNSIVTCTFNSGVFTQPPNCNGTSTYNGVGAGSSVVDIVATNTTLTFQTVDLNNTPKQDGAQIICQKQGADFTAAKQLSNGNTYSSTNADTDWASCGHTAASFTGFGTPTSIETQCKRQGSDLLMRGNFTSGTQPGVELRLSLPLWNGLQLTSAGSTSIISIQTIGDMGFASQNATYFRSNVLIEPSVSYVTFGNQASTTNILSKATTTSSGAKHTFNARIPIAGWENSNIIIGQFNGLESCSSTLDCTDTFSASVTSAGVVVAGSENVDWINGNCTFGTGYLCNFNSSIFTVAPNCTVTASDTTGGLSLLSSTTTSSVTPIFISRTDAGSTNVATPFRIICQKAGIDYTSKTAKAVASDQNVSSPGTLKATLCSADISATGVISNQDGGCFSSCTNATTPVCTFTSNFWVTTPKCWFNGGSIGYVWTQTLNSTTFSGVIANNAGAAQPGARQYFCHGARQ